MKIKHVFCFAIVVALIYFMTGDCKRANAASEEPFLFSDETKEEYQGEESICIQKNTTFHLVDDVTYAQVKKITFEKDVEELTACMFLQFPNAEEIELPEKLTKLNGCFYPRYTDIYHHEHVYSLEKLDSLTISKENPNFMIKDQVLYSKDMTTILYYPTGKTDLTYQMPESVKSLDVYAFGRNDCLEKLGISSNLEPYSLLMLTQAYLPNLTEYTVSSDNEYAVEDGVLFNQEKTKLLSYPQGRKAEVYSIPETVTELSDTSFYNATIDRVVLSPNVNYVPREFEDPSYDYYESPTVNFDMPFDHSHIKEFEIPENEYCSIVDGVIYNKDKTRLVYWPTEKKVTNLKFPSTLKSLIIDGNIPCISEITSLTIPRDVKRLQLSDSMPSLKTVQVDKGNKQCAIFSGCLYSSDYKHLILVPSKLNRATITIAKNFTCSNTITDEVPAVTSIIVNGKVDAFNFEGFPNLSKISLAKNYKGAKVVNNVLYSKNMKTLIWYPQAKKDKKFIMPSSVVTMNHLAFEYQKYLQSITLSKNLKLTQPTTVTWFAECNRLKEIKVAAGSKNLTAVNGVLFTKDKTILVCYPAGKTAKSYTVPAQTKTFFFKAGNAYLTTIKLPKNLNEFIMNNLLYNDFHSFTKLQNITVDSGNKTYYSEDGILYKKNEDETSDLIAYPMGKTADTYTIPEQVRSIECFESLQSHPYLKNITSLTSEYYVVGNEIYRTSGDFFLR